MKAILISLLSIGYLQANAEILATAKCAGNPAIETALLPKKFDKPLVLTSGKEQLVEVVNGTSYIVTVHEATEAAPKESIQIKMLNPFNSTVATAQIVNGVGAVSISTGPSPSLYYTVTCDVLVQHP